MSFKGAFAKLVEIQSNIVAHSHIVLTDPFKFSKEISDRVSLFILDARLYRVLDFSKAKLL